MVNDEKERPAVMGSPRRVQVRFLLGTKHRRFIDAIVASKRFRYGFPSDFYRHAVQLLLEQLAQKMCLESIFIEHDMKVAAEAQANARYYQSELESIKAEVNRYVEMGQFNPAKRALNAGIRRLTRDRRSDCRNACIAKLKRELERLLDADAPDSSEPYKLSLLKVSTPHLRRANNGSE
jgi:Arc/MetJ-type ribon-helix-helix transcriptional regulator